MRTLIAGCLFLALALALGVPGARAQTAAPAAPAMAAPSPTGPAATMDRKPTMAKAPVMKPGLMHRRRAPHRAAMGRPPRHREMVRHHTMRHRMMHKAL